MTDTTVSPTASRTPAIEATEPVRTTMTVRVVIVIGATVVAYRHSLISLGELFTYDTPLAYLSLVPLLALGLAVALARPRLSEPRLPDPQVDWIVGVPLLGVAAVFALWFPARLSYHYWLERIDLLGLPFFVAGVTALVLGARLLWRLRLSVLVLFLAWPVPFEAVLTPIISATTRLTLAAITAVGPMVPGVTHIEGSTFVLGTGARAFDVNVAAECAGASGLLGFALMAGAATVILGGSRIRRLSWVVVGLPVVLASNLFRLVLLFWVGANWGEEAAIRWLHPVAGLVLFTVVAGAWAWLALRVGLRPPPRPRIERTRSFAPLSVLAVVAVVVASVAFGQANDRLAALAPFAGIDSDRQVPSLVTQPLAAGDWDGRRTDEITWATQYFGASATWDRYTVWTTQGAPQTAYLDVVGSDDLGRFETYGIEACYRFHEYALLHSGTIDVGTAVPAQAIVYENPDAAERWAVVSWLWPVRADEARFERVTMLRRLGPSDDQDAVLDALAVYGRSLVDAAHQR